MDDGLGIELLEMPPVQLDKSLELASAAFLLCLLASQVGPAGLGGLFACGSEGDVQLVLAVGLDFYQVLVFSNQPCLDCLPLLLELGGVVRQAFNLANACPRR
ncbi:hypothetical protein [Pseudomonas aeruginosa]|uniref:hypothetical protein n=1 Tax=Pseudomonas aeruginosa TaxID=287 RepID=UPI001F27C10A|nr:hypothetical protein [Pseudomonas aeruginosa]